MDDLKTERTLLLGGLVQMPENTLEKVLAIEEKLIQHFKGLIEEDGADLALPAISLATMTVASGMEN
jgi:hypothetical protein